MPYKHSLKSLVLLIAGCFFNLTANAAAIYEATSEGTLTLIALDGPVSVAFFDPDPFNGGATPGGSTPPGVLVVNDSGTDSAVFEESDSPVPPEVGSSITQTATVSGSRSLPGLIVTDLLTTILIRVENISPPDASADGFFTVRWEWDLDVLTKVDDPLTEFAGATAGAFLRRR